MGLALQHTQRKEPTGGNSRAMETPCGEAVITAASDDAALRRLTSRESRNEAIVAVRIWVAATLAKRSWKRFSIVPAIDRA